MTDVTKYLEIRLIRRQAFCSFIFLRAKNLWQRTEITYNALNKYGIRESFHSKEFLC
jgi:hypothetical protein